MIYAIWLINRSGTPILSRTYKGFNVDPVLFSGLITAILGFAKEISGQEISEISMGNFKLLVHTYVEGPILVLAVSSEEDKTKYIDFVEDIRGRIIRRYGLFEEPNINAIPVIIRDLDSMVSQYGFIIAGEEAVTDILLDENAQKLLLHLILNKGLCILPKIEITGDLIISYPELKSVVSINPSELKFLLETLTKNGYLIRETYASILQCPLCKTSHVITVATCPHCGSSSIVKKIFIEHFRCGYIGPKTLFTSGKAEKLVCPSCKRELEVADFREFESFYCEHCNSLVNEPAYKIFCLKCNKYFNLNETNIFTISSYSLNEKAREFIEKKILKQLVKPVPKQKISKFHERFMHFKKLSELRSRVRLFKKTSKKKILL